MLVDKLFVYQRVVIQDVYDNKFRVCNITAIDSLFITVEWQNEIGNTRTAQYPIRDLELQQDYIIYAEVPVY